MLPILCSGLHCTTPASADMDGDNPGATCVRSDDASSVCPNCKVPFLHQHHPTAPSGYYYVYCPREQCTRKIHRCSACSFCTYAKKYGMLRHLEQSHSYPPHQNSDHEANHDDLIFDHHSSLSPPVVSSPKQKQPPASPQPLSESHQHPSLLDRFHSDILKNSEIISQRPSVKLLFEDFNTIDNQPAEPDPDAVHEELLIENQLSYISHPPAAPNNIITETDSPPESLTVSDLSYIKNPHSRVFFCQQHNHPHGGIRGAAKRANTSDLLNSKLTSFEEADLLFDLMDNLVSQTPAEQLRFLQSHHKHAQAYKPSKPTYNIEIPTSRSSADRILLKSNTALYNLIPCENAFSLPGDPHAMISMDDKIDTLFALGVEFDFFQDHTGKISKEGYNATVRLG